MSLNQSSPFRGIADFGRSRHLFAPETPSPPGNWQGSDGPLSQLGCWAFPEVRFLGHYLKARSVFPCWTNLNLCINHSSLQVGIIFLGDISINSTSDVNAANQYYMGLGITGRFSYILHPKSIRCEGLGGQRWWLFIGWITFSLSHLWLCFGSRRSLELLLWNNSSIMSFLIDLHICCFMLWIIACWEPTFDLPFLVQMLFADMFCYIHISSVSMCIMCSLLFV